MNSENSDRFEVKSPNMQAELSLVKINRGGPKSRWLPLYAKKGDDITMEELGCICVAAWLGPAGEDSRLQGTGAYTIDRSSANLKHVDNSEGHVMVQLLTIADNC